MKRQHILKLVRTHFKRLTSRLLKISFSLYAPITSDECRACFHLNAASQAVRNTEQVNITIHLVHDWIRTTNTACYSDFKSTIITTRQELAWYDKEIKYPWNLYLYDL